MKVEPTLNTARLSRRGVLFVAAGTLFTAACGNGDDGDSPGPTTRNSEEIVIGASLELTGYGAALGTLQERALQITAKRLNENGVPVGNLRRTVRLVVRDNGSNPANAGKQVQEMISRDGVNAIIGGTLPETSMEVVKVAQDQQVPFLSLAASDNVITPLSDRTYIYKLTPDAAAVAALMATAIKGQEGSKVAVIAARGAHGDSGVAAFNAQVAANDLSVVATARLGAPGGNVGPAVTAALEGAPDTVVVWASAPDAGVVARELRGAGKFKGKLFFEPTAVADETLVENNLPALNNAFAIHPDSLAGPSLTDTTRAELSRRDFINSYIQEYETFNGFAPYAADGVTLIVNAARLARSVDHGRLRVFLETQVTEGIAGAYQFQPNRHGGMAADSLAVFKFTQGSWSRFN